MAPNQQIKEAFKFQQTNEKFKEILYDGFLYDVSTFLSRHPGGHEILLNFTESVEDATLAIQQFHSRSIDKVLKMMKFLPNRRQPQIELCEEMEQVRRRNAEMTADFVALYAEMKEKGPNAFSKFVGSFLAAMVMGRRAWMMHEFGHHSATGNPKLDRFLHDVVLGTCWCVSGIWWRRHHNLHHAKANQVEADPDLLLLPGVFIASPKILKDVAADQTFFQRNQIFFAPVIAIVIYFRWMSTESFPYLLRKRNLVEWISIFFHYFIMYQFGFQMWLMTASLFSFYLFFDTMLSHTYVPMTTAPTYWIEQCFVNTVNVRLGRFVNWWMGYLNYQVEHHLFPTLPQFRSPLLVDRVKALGKKHGLPYHADSYFTTGKKALVNLHTVSEFVKSVA